MTPVMSVAALADGAMVPVRIEGVDLLICRVDGRFYALANRCSHAGQALHGGRLKGHELICPLHGARFDVRDGRPLKAPAVQGVTTYPVVIEAGRVGVSVSRPRPAPQVVPGR